MHACLQTFVFVCLKSPDGVRVDQRTNKHGRGAHQQCPRHPQKRSHQTVLGVGAGWGQQRRAQGHPSDPAHHPQPQACSGPQQPRCIGFNRDRAWARRFGQVLQQRARVDLLPHPLFKLDDDGLLHIKIPIDGFGWMAQRAVDVPTLDGLRTLRMVREQRHYRLPAAGYPSRKPGLRGDLAVEVEPVFPARLSSEQQRLLDQLMAASAGSEETAPEPRLAQWKRDLQAWQRKHQQQQRKR